MATETNQQQNTQIVNPVDQVNAIVQNQALAQASASLYANNISQPSGASYGLTGGAWAAEQAMKQASGSQNFTQNYIQSQQLLLSQQAESDKQKAALGDVQNAQVKMGLGYLAGIKKKVTGGILNEQGLKGSLGAGYASGAITEDQYQKAFALFDPIAVDNLDPEKAQATMDRVEKDMVGLKSKSWNDMSEAERQTFLEYQSGKK